MVFLDDFRLFIKYKKEKQRPVMALLEICSFTPLYLANRTQLNIR